jgi:hypothetical protein
MASLGRLSEQFLEVPKTGRSGVAAVHCFLSERFVACSNAYCKTVLIAFIALAAPLAAWAGGPKYVAGTSYFNPGVVGQPIHWAGGQLNYFVDQGALSSSVNNQQATAMVDAAAALWSAVPTAGVILTDMGPLNEDVNGSNIAAPNGVITNPYDVTPQATGYPVGVIFDEDGSVIDAIYGTGTSMPSACQNNSVYVWMDSINTDTTIAHGIILLNGRCATSSSLLAMMSFELERAFGRILGLDFAQVNPGALQNGEAGGTMGWPVMQPQSGVCGSTGGVCIPSPSQLRVDDIAALNRIYPITTGNLSNFHGKEITAANTVSIRGTITFASGMGMQGVNVVARPLDKNGNPLYQYTVTFVSGAYFGGNHGSVITGFTDENNNPLSMWGSNQASLQGFFDLSGMPLPPGVKTANYQVTFEAVNPMYMLDASVGPYVDGSPNPSGTLQAISVPSLSAGSAQTLTVNVVNSAEGGNSAIGSQNAPRMLPASGMWAGRLSKVGQTDWLSFPVRGGTTFTIVTQALDENGRATSTKAIPVTGVWSASDSVSSSPAASAGGLNGGVNGEVRLEVSSAGNDIVRLAIADLRGDGRPDYTYRGWVLYADTVQPQRLPATGGSIVIRGMGFHATDTVLVGGQPATITSITANEITAVVPAATSGVSGSVDVEVDDAPGYYASAVISGGVSYDSGTGDSLTLLAAPMNTVPVGVPQPFSVIALGANMKPAGGVTVVYTVTSGDAVLGCGQSSCPVTATGDGRATMSVTATDSTWSIVTVSLTNGASLQAQFAGGTPPAVTALTPMLSVAAGATVSWPVQTLVLSGGAPVNGQSVVWSPGTGISIQSSYAQSTNRTGIATQTLTVGPLAEGQVTTATACLNGGSQCVTFTAMGARPEYATIQPVTGTAQSFAVNGTANQITLRVMDMDGNPMAGGTVSIYQAVYLWTPPCPQHGRCAQPMLLGTASVTATSALDGTVTFTPAYLPGIATITRGIAATGNTGTVNFQIEQHP